MTPLNHQRYHLTVGPAMSGRFNAGQLAAVAAVIIALVISFQLRLHCYTADLQGDEASHYITGLMIHDYLFSGFASSPIGYVKAFHSHYPLVGIGHWGPFYYFIEAIWMVLFSPDLASVLALPAAVTVVTALGIYVFGSRMSGGFAGLFAACAFILSPIVQAEIGELMLDIPIALLCFAAMSAYSQFLEKGTARYSVAFALAASAALLIKGNAGCLALLPPFAILFARRFDLLRKGAFWLPIPIVGVLVGPWYFITYGLVAAGFRYQWGWDYVAVATTANATELVKSMGPLILAIALVGFIAIIRRAWTRGAGNAQSTVCALLIAVWIFQCIVPAAIQSRYLAPLIPPLLLLAAEGIRVISAWAQLVFRWRAVTTEAVLALLLLVSIVPEAISAPMKPELGFMAAALQAWRVSPAQNPAILIAADGQGESAAIAALAMRDPNRPSLFAIRGSRLLGGGGYNNQDYVPRFKTVQEVMAAIHDYHIPLMLYRTATPGNGDWLHLKQLAELQLADPGRWQEIYRNTNVNPEITLLRINGHENEMPDTQRLMSLSAPRALGGTE
jgi:hypothetical protein